MLVLSMDIFSKKKRSEIMCRIGVKNTKPELIVRKILFARGYRYRLHVKKLPGSPDIVFPSKKKVIFVHGCFWHGHRNCQKSRLPATNIHYWTLKRNGNTARDRKVSSRLRKLGWKVLIIWECQLDDVVSISKRIVKYLTIMVP